MHTSQTSGWLCRSPHRTPPLPCGVVSKARCSHSPRCALHALQAVSHSTPVPQPVTILAQLTAHAMGAPHWCQWTASGILRLTQTTWFLAQTRKLVRATVTACWLARPLLMQLKQICSRCAVWAHAAMSASAQLTSICREHLVVLSAMAKVMCINTTSEVARLNHVHIVLQGWQRSQHIKAFCQ